MMRNGAETEQGGWTRRGTLVALAAVVAAPALPAAATAPAVPPAALAEICIAATAAPLSARLGAVAARGRSLPEVAASLCGQLGSEGAGNWRNALVTSGRRDIAKGDTVEIMGRRLMRTEAEMLALGVLLRGPAPLVT